MEYELARRLLVLLDRMTLNQEELLKLLLDIGNGIQSNQNGPVWRSMMALAVAVKTQVGDLRILMENAVEEEGRGCDGPGT